MNSSIGEKLRSLENDLKAILDSYNESVALWLSGGKDSLLLLNVLLKLGRKFNVLSFTDSAWNEAQKKQLDEIILRHNLQVYSYPAHKFLLIGSGAGELAFASYYAIDREGHCATVLRDVVSGDTGGDGGDVCAFDLQIETSALAFAPLEFGAHIWGSRFRDRHWSHGLESVLRRDHWKLGHTDFYAPLSGWSDRQIYGALKSFGAFEAHQREAPDNADTGNVTACAECLKAAPGEKVFCPKQQKQISALDWDKAGNTKIFRASLGLTD